VKTTVDHQFEDAQQQAEAAGLGVWAFLTTEVLFFGGLFCAYTMYRLRYPAAFQEAAQHLYLWLGALNTAILLGSSLTMALAVRATALHERRRTIGWLAVTLGLGAAFLGVKSIEYVIDIQEGLLPGAGHTSGDAEAVDLFYTLYWIMTSLHAVHVIAGLVTIAGMMLLTALSRSVETLTNLIDGAGLYWHFVDIVWIFLFPLLYLIG
jgi:cytochrome c oxidase subunit 3